MGCAIMPAMDKPKRPQDTPGTEAYERAKARQRAYYAAHRGELIAKSRRWAEEHNKWVEKALLTTPQDLCTVPTPQPERKG